MKDFLLALDFDGVIWDSVGECYRTGRNAWASLFEGLPEVSEEGFRRGRWLVRTGGEFGLVLRLQVEQPEQDLETFPREEFEALAVREREWVARFEAAFYAERARARREELPAWLASQAPYQAVLDELPSLLEAFRELVICTTKDEASTRELLATAGLEFPILAKEFSLDKRDHMRHLCSTRGMTPGQVVFVDDLLPNLDPVSEVGVRVALAGWGYNTPAGRVDAAERGIPVLYPGTILADLRAHVLEG